MARRTNVIMLTLGSRSGGVVTRADLLAEGLSSSSVAGRVQAGFLLTVWPGVYEIPELGDATTPLFRAVKASPGSVISHHTAGSIQGMSRPFAPGDLVDLTVRRGTTRSQPPGVVAHETRRPPTLDPDPPIPGLPVTAPARTVLDLAGTSLSNRRLAHLVETQLTAKRLTLDELAGTCADVDLRGVPGAARLRRLLAGLTDGQPVGDSMLERRFARFLRCRGIVGFRRQFVPPWFDGGRGVVDFAHPGAAVIVEVDGRPWHATTQAMADDRRRDRTAAANGWTVLRVMASDLADTPTDTADQVMRAVSNRLAGAGCRP
ncbi:MAG: DUF559 domain-containing protein [Acidimicrobiales bacterium]